MLDCRFESRQVPETETEHLHRKWRGDCAGILCVTPGNPTSHFEHVTVMFAWQLDIQIHPSHGKKQNGLGPGWGGNVVCIFFKFCVRLFSLFGRNGATLARRGGSIKTVPGVSNMKGGGFERIIEGATLSDTPSFRYITSRVCWFKTFMVSQPRVAQLSYQ